MAAREMSLLSTRGGQALWGFTQVMTFDSHLQIKKEMLGLYTDDDILPSSPNQGDATTQILQMRILIFTGNFAKIPQARDPFLCDTRIHVLATTLYFPQLTSML